MKAIISDEIAPLMQEPTSESISITSLRKGDEFEVGKIIRKKKEVWVQSTLPNGTMGYIKGGTKIFAIKRVEAVGNPLEVYESPDASTAVLTTIPKRTSFTVRGFEKVDDQEWFAVVTDEGIKGYVHAGVKMRVVPEVTQGSARKMMITGAFFTVAAIVLYFLPRAGAEGAVVDASFLTIALLLLGLFQVGQGYMQYRQAKKKDEGK